MALAKGLSQKDLLTRLPATNATLIFEGLDAQSLARGELCKFFSPDIQKEKLWKKLILLDITKKPQLKPGDSYKTFYKQAYRLFNQIRQAIKNPNTSAEECRELFIAAVVRGYEKCAHHLLKNRNIDLDLALPSTNSPSNTSYLHLAAHYGCTTSVELLLENKAQVDPIDSGFVNPKQGPWLNMLGPKPTPCIYQPRFDQWKVGAGVTPLARAAAGGHADCLRLLLLYHADVNHRSLADGRTALHRAAENGHTQCVELLLLMRKVKTDIPDHHGVLPLECAQVNKHDLCAKLIAAKMQKDGIKTPQVSSSWSELIKYFLS